MSLFQFLREYFPDSIVPARGLTGITADSRRVVPGNLFAALPGTQHDGAHYISQAIAAGATMILVAEEDYERLALACHPTVQFLCAKDPRAVFAKMAAAFHEVQPETCVAVTGTNGKSSVVDFVRQLWTLKGHQAASIGTLGIKGPMPKTHGGLTTPDPFVLHGQLAQLAVTHHVTHCALEASSHGLDQRRLDGIRFKAAAFTQLTQDHLDYHITMEAYFRAKKRLFEELITSMGACILNADVAEYATLRAIALKRRLHVLDYGKNAQALVLHKIVPHEEGQQLHVEIFGRQIQWSLPLIGQFQAYNFLCALGLALASETKTETLLDLLADYKELPIQSVTGRLERIVHAGKTVYVDYAHTPDALKHVLTTIRPHVKGRIIVVFGCGGERDDLKRPLMGQIAEQLGDYVVITDDNPRNEDPAQIRHNIRTGMKGRVPIQDIADRRKAIAHALSEASPTDAVLIAGKGHETTLLIRGVEHPFSDQGVVREILRG
ncbi:MAG: UDP-N-acetylmuramoyl-L-alanyl-D-glutamate--2,6-diaminopimelate ligase [Holosporales bacterium]|jgi:UDP-N-acetylmuramoyl-L-alanyl-D-glutamate--2,6-diaminopimelate ligase|nr:UDP-N-acetylmuramoyl-L-alanyl-D-glutamate--2,6-diaminopimelate ligase [Holosporales bacterium]